MGAVQVEDNGVGVERLDCGGAAQLEITKEEKKSFEAQSNYAAYFWETVGTYPCWRGDKV